MLIAHHGYKQFGTRSATIMVHRVDRLGIFDNYTENFDRIWTNARHIATSDPDLNHQPPPKARVSVA